MRAGHVHGPLATNLPPISGTRTASALALVKSETFVLGQTSSGNQSISSMNLDNISRPLDSSWPQGHDNKATRLESMNEDDPLPQIQESEQRWGVARERHSPHRRRSPGQPMGCPCREACRVRVEAVRVKLPAGTPSFHTRSWSEFLLLCF